MSLYYTDAQTERTPGLDDRSVAPFPIMIMEKILVTIVHTDGRLMAFVSTKSGGWSTRAGSSYPPSREQFLRSLSIIIMLL